MFMYLLSIYFSPLLDSKLPRVGQALKSYLWNEEMNQIG